MGLQEALLGERHTAANARESANLRQRRRFASYLPIGPSIGTGFKQELNKTVELMYTGVDPPRFHSDQYSAFRSLP